MAYEFNGTNQSLTTNAAPLNGATTAFTMALWFQLKGSLSASNGLAALNDSSHSFTLFTTNAAKIGASHSSVSTATFGAISTNSIEQNVWTHAAGVYQTTASRSIFLNGSQNTNNSSLSTVGSSNSFSVATRRTSGTFGLFGNIEAAEVGIWNAALTAAEIASLAKGMTCDKVRPESLVFYAPLVRDLQDLSGGLTITNNNTATVATHPRVYA
jgi:hypothetical protein